MDIKTDETARWFELFEEVEIVVFKIYLNNYFLATASGLEFSVINFSKEAVETIPG